MELCLLSGESHVNSTDGHIDMNLGVPHGVGVKGLFHQRIRVEHQIMRF